MSSGFFKNFFAPLLVLIAGSMAIEYFKPMIPSSSLSASYRFISIYPKILPKKDDIVAVEKESNFFQTFNVLNYFRDVVAYGDLVLYEIVIDNTTNARSKPIEISIGSSFAAAYVLSNSSSKTAYSYLNIHNKDNFKIDYIDPKSKLLIYVLGSDYLGKYFDPPSPKILILSGSDRVEPKFDPVIEGDTTFKWSFWFSLRFPIFSIGVYLCGLLFLIITPIMLYITYRSERDLEFAYRFTNKGQLDQMRKIVSYADKKDTDKLQISPHEPIS